MLISLKKNRHFINSDYYYKGKLEFFHLTSIDNLWSILNSRTFRMYNLHSSKDESEYNYAAKILDLPDKQIEFRKQYTYTLSFCPTSDLETKEIWEVYGDNFKGAAVVFEIANDPIEWMNFHISEVKYDKKACFVNYKQRLNEIKSQFDWANDRTDLSQLICFHKTSKWQNEKEIRIATYFPYKKQEEYLKYSKTEFRLEERRNRITNYIELPLWVNNDSHLIKSNDIIELDRTQKLPLDYFASRPKIKIKDILIGYKSGISIQEFEKFRLSIIDTIRYNCGYNIELSYSLFEL